MFKRRCYEPGIYHDQSGAVMLEVLDKKVFARLISRLGLGDYGLPIKASISEQILPVTMVDDLLGDAKIEVSTQDLTGAGLVVYFTVPAKRRWTLLFIQRASTTGTSQISIKSLVNAVELSDVGTSNEYIYPGRKIQLEEGWLIRMAGTSNGADGAILMKIWIIEEKVQ